MRERERERERENRGLCESLLRIRWGLCSRACDKVLHFKPAAFSVPTSVQMLKSTCGVWEMKGGETESTLALEGYVRRAFCRSRRSTRARARCTSRSEPQIFGISGNVPEIRVNRNAHKTLWLGRRPTSRRSTARASLSSSAGQTSQLEVMYRSLDSKGTV